jgi:hypothetical protein
MPKKPRDARELAARALCRFHGVPENIRFEGRPMWMNFLRETDVVLQAIGWKVDSEAPKINSTERPERQA